MKKILCFARVSTEFQDLEQHKVALTKKAISLGYTKKNIIFVGGKESGYCYAEDERKTLQEMWEVLDADSDIDCVLAYEVSRISRKPDIAFSVRSKLQSRHIQLIIMQPECICFDTDTWDVKQSSNLIFGIFATTAENERNLLIARTRRGKEQKCANGYYIGGPVTYGYKLDSDKKLIIDEETAHIIRKIFTLRVEQKYTAKQITDELNQTGVHIKWSRVTSILRNELYTGRLSVSNFGKKTQKRLPPIISEELYDASRKVNNIVASVRKPRKQREYLGRKILKCSECGNLIQVHISRGNAYYSCGTHTRHTRQDKYCSNNIIIKVSIVDVLIWDFTKRCYKILLLRDKQHTLVSLHQEKENLSQKISASDGEIEKIDRKMLRAKKLYLNDDMSDEEYDQRTAEVRQEKMLVIQKVNQWKIKVQKVSEDITVLENDETPREEKLKILDNIDQTDDVEKKCSIVNKVMDKITLGKYKDTNDRELVFYHNDTIDKFIIKNRTGDYIWFYSECEGRVMMDFEVGYEIGKTDVNEIMVDWMSLLSPKS